MCQRGFVFKSGSRVGKCTASKRQGVSDMQSSGPKSLVCHQKSSWDDLAKKEATRNVRILDPQLVHQLFSFLGEGTRVLEAKCLFHGNVSARQQGIYSKPAFLETIDSIILLFRKKCYRKEQISLLLTTGPCPGPAVLRSQGGRFKL